jgi:hypothetical protein
MFNLDPQQRPRRRKLTVRNPAVEPFVQDLTGMSPDINDVRDFARVMLTARNAWSIRSGGAAAHRRISRGDADMELRRALAALKGGKDA